jgi:antitoxin (DNA-binding transcriptional repressor) of toxin-antitoxin stability system
MGLAAQGEEVIIARAGVPYVRLVGFTPPCQRKIGGYKRLIKYDNNSFDSINDDITRLFESES